MRLGQREEVWIEREEVEDVRVGAHRRGCGGSSTTSAPAAREIGADDGRTRERRGRFEAEGTTRSSANESEGRALACYAGLGECIGFFFSFFIKAFSIHNFFKKNTIHTNPKLCTDIS